MTIEIITQNGEEKVVLSRSDYEDLIDIRDNAAAMAAVAAGAPVLTDAEVGEYLAAKTPLAFWRRRAGLTQAKLARKVGISQPFLAQIELDTRAGGVALYAKLARALGIRMEDLMADDE